MPRITPGITSGASMSSDSADLPRKSTRSSRNAFAVPTATDSTVTALATQTDVTMLFRSGASAKSPVRPCPPTNQSSVNPRHGGAG